MSIVVENIENDIDVKDLLVSIDQQLKLLNARIEEAFDTGIDIEDID